MTIFFDAPVEPDALTAFVRETPLPSVLRLQQLFPTVTQQNNTIDWSEITQTNRTARFRSFDGRIHVSERDGTTDKQVRMLPLSDSLSMGEYERLQLEFARTGGTRSEALANAIYNDAERLTRHVQYRMEQAIGDVLTDGKLTINENGLIQEADFGVPGTQIVTAATPWTTIATAPALTDLITWIDVYIAANGFPPGSILTSTRVKRLMQTNKQLIDAAVGAAAGKSRLNMEQLGDLLSAEGVPDTLEVYDTVVDVDGVSTRTIPDDRLIFLPPNLGDAVQVRMGVSATALELVGSNLSELDFEDSPGIVGVVEKVGPPYRQFTFVDAVGMPVLANAKTILIADVAA